MRVETQCVVVRHLSAQVAYGDTVGCQRLWNKIDLDFLKCPEMSFKRGVVILLVDDFDGGGGGGGDAVIHDVTVNIFSRGNGFQYTPKYGHR